MTAEFSIHNHLKDRKPNYVRKPKPTFRTLYEKDKYWDGQKKRWLEGYGGLTGLHYFACQEGVIPDANGQPIRYLWRDGDQLVCESYEEAKKLYWDLFILKRREFGISSLFGGIAPLYYALLYPKSTCFLTSADKDRIKLLYGQKLMTAYDYLDVDIKSPKARYSQAGHLLLAEEERKGVYKGLQSEIWCKETVKKPTAPEAFRLKYAFLDELFLHPKAGEVRASAMRCFMKGKDKIGTFVMGGSCGIGTTAGVDEGKRIYIDSANNRTLTVFLPGTLCVYGFTHNGWSDEKAAYDWIMKNREDLSKAENKTLYFKEIADYPLHEEEVLNMVTDSVLPESIQLKLKQSLNNILVKGIKDHTYVIEPTIHTGQLVARPDPKGKFHIIIPPEKGHVYGAGLDPIPFGNAALDDNKNSKLALIIKDRYTGQHVAYYIEREMDINEAFNNCCLLQDYYFGTPALIELNRGEALYIKYRDKGRTDLMRTMPTSLGIKFEKRKYPHGLSKNPRVEEKINAFWFDYLYGNAANMVCRELIEQTTKWTKVNTDLVDAAIMEIADHVNSIKEADRVKGNRVEAQVVTTYRDANGVTHRKLVTRTVSLQQKTMEELMANGVAKPSTTYNPTGNLPK